MNSVKSGANGVTGTPKPKPPQLAGTSVSDRDSVRSRAMPGAEPPTPTPAPDALVANTGDKPSSEPETVQVQGYDVQDVPHVVNPDTTASQDEVDLEAGVLPPVTFDFDEPEAPQQVQPQEEAEEELASESPDVTRTPRPELKTEESLAPLDLGNLPSTAQHTAEASDATAVSVSPRTGPGSGTPPVWTPGTYVLLNARSGTAMDLHGGNNKAVIGFPMHGGPNQQWDFIPMGHGYAIRCVRPAKTGHALYLTVEGGVKNKAPIVASAYPVAWNVEQTEDGLRIAWPGSDFVFDLADWGNSKPSTKIELMPRISHACQLWHYTRCAPASQSERDHEKEMGVEARSARALSSPATTETVTIVEERDFVTTTRTTTTTVITTVTEVTRTPKSLLRPGQPAQQAQRRSIGYR